MSEHQAQAKPQPPLVKISRADLPLCCPRGGDQVWNQHPRVYLTLSQARSVGCPYCGTRYQLED